LKKIIFGVGLVRKMAKENVLGKNNTVLQV